MGGLPARSLRPPHVEPRPSSSCAVLAILNRAIIIQPTETVNVNPPRRAAWVKFILAWERRWKESQGGRIDAGAAAGCPGRLNRLRPPPLPTRFGQNPQPRQAARKSRPRGGDNY